VLAVVALASFAYFGWFLLYFWFMVRVRKRMMNDEPLGPDSSDPR
jgi:hypothetical protein